MADSKAVKDSPFQLRKRGRLGPSTMHFLYQEKGSMQSTGSCNSHAEKWLSCSNPTLIVSGRCRRRTTHWFGRGPQPGEFPSPPHGGSLTKGSSFRPCSLVDAFPHDLVHSLPVHDRWTWIAYPLPAA
eukprot:1157276-Pelagomonas_calceolata.AAC.5